MPITIPCQGSTKPEAGVIVPRPATAPEIVPSTEGFPRVHHSRSVQVNAPAEAARCVATMAKTAREPAASAEPPLNPNQPTQRSPVPITASDSGREILAAVARTPPDYVGGDEPGDARIEVDDGAACKIE